MKQNEFPCVGCGLCCKKIGIALKNKDKYPDELKQELEAFPYSANEEGVCEKFKDDKCTIYHSRPTLCRVDSMYAKHYKKKMTRKDFYNTQIIACKNLMAEAGVIEKNKLNLIK